MNSTFKGSLLIGNIFSKKFKALRFFSITVKSYSNESSSKGFFQKLMDITPVSPHKSAHSKVLTQNKVIYEIQFENVKPEFRREYLKETALMMTSLSNNKSFPGILVGSWTTLYGDLDQAVHIWSYADGYDGAMNSIRYMNGNKEYQEYEQVRGHWLKSRKNQLLQEFSFWGTPQPRGPSHIYELRSYRLKPGTLIEWGNKWGSAIQIRRKDAVGGFFSQVGDLYEVHHMWAYHDLEHRKKQREDMWEAPGWDDLVAGTIPLVRSMEARVLQPISSSPMQ
ncbi:protein NipSnap homolog 1 isoform X1 [Hydra vulgaris]|uniref:Protein NipSnap homolog 1 n=1 Tax=Hydra vulgaris TaxID=6087 RepID=T2M6T2_HYDVU|nr:protein NipSnap homolog 1 [Hydra vulgaris]